MNDSPLWWFEPVVGQHVPESDASTTTPGDTSDVVGTTVLGLVLRRASRRAEADRAQDTAPRMPSVGPSGP
ncbi:MAG: hypothetical protein ACR2LQ_07325 [Acidimicrobiales bacterium]